MELADETFSGAYFNATQFTRWLFDDAVAEFLSGNRIKPSDVVKNRVTVFVHVPLDVLLTTPAVARIVLDALTWAFIEADGDYAARTLLLVDEASKLGRMTSIEMVRDTGRKYGLTLQLLYLSEAELAEVWGPKGPARWFATVSWRGYAATSDRETAEGLSKDFGEFGALATSEGGNSGSSGKGFEIGSRSKGKTNSLHEVKRRLILPSELQQARKDEMFVVRQGSNQSAARKPPISGGRISTGASRLTGSSRPPRNKERQHHGRQSIDAGKASRGSRAVPYEHRRDRRAKPGWCRAAESPST